MENLFDTLFIKSWISSKIQIDKSLVILQQRNKLVDFSLLNLITFEIDTFDPLIIVEILYRLINGVSRQSIVLKIDFIDSCVGDVELWGFVVPLLKG